MKPRHCLILLALAGTLIFAGCTQYASVTSARPKIPAATSTARELINAVREEKRKPLDGIGEFLAAAQTAQQ